MKNHSLITSVAILFSLRADIIGAQDTPTTRVSPLYKKNSVANVNESMTINGQSVSGHSKDKATVELVNGNPPTTKIVADIHI